MRIEVKNMGDKDIHLMIPTGLLFNPVTALILPGTAKSQGVHMTARQAMAFIKILHDCKRRFPNWLMVEAEDADGGKVEIKL
jgi:hypothetical protein